MEIFFDKYEIGMWEALKNRDTEAFLQFVNQDTVMVCGGYRCSGTEYAEFVKEFDIYEYRILAQEVIIETEDLIQLHYVIECFVKEERNKDLEGEFHVVSTWQKKNDKWMLKFNMDSRIIKPM